MKLAFGFVRDHKPLNGFTSPPLGRRVLSSKPRLGVGSDWKPCALRLSWRSLKRATGLALGVRAGETGISTVTGDGNTERSRRLVTHPENTPSFQKQSGAARLTFGAHPQNLPPQWLRTPREGPPQLQGARSHKSIFN